MAMTREDSHLIQWACQQRLNRVTTLTDAGQWDALAACYTRDAVLIRPSDPDNALQGRDAILESFRARPPRVTCHLLANSVFDVRSPERVTATSRVLLISGAAGQASPVKADARFLVGSFIDDLVNVDGEWLIARRVGSIELSYGG